MKGVNYITDENNRKMAVVIDLKKNGELWEDFYDFAIANSRKGEAKVSFDKVLAKLKKAGKL